MPTDANFDFKKSLKNSMPNYTVCVADKHGILKVLNTKPIDTNKNGAGCIEMKVVKEYTM